MNVGTICARIRMPLLWAGVLAILASTVIDLPGLIGLVLLVLGLALYFRIGTVRAAPVVLRSPVAGRWEPVNSPTDRVPSHGLHAYGQTYAVDLVHVPADRERPAFGWSPLSRPPEDFPAYGQPVYAPADGTVVRVHGRARDHRSRNSWPALIALLVVEAGGRELLGPRFILGNHLVIDLGDGRYALLAHLRHGSLRVSAGDRVTAGQQLAECGNTGNSTEPHLHFQVMDSPRVLFAAGLPIGFDRYTVDGAASAGMPRNGEAFDAPAPAATTGTAGA